MSSPVLYVVGCRFQIAPLKITRHAITKQIGGSIWPWQTQARRSSLNSAVSPGEALHWDAQLRSCSNSSCGPLVIAYNCIPLSAEGYSVVWHGWSLMKIPSSSFNFQNSLIHWRAATNSTVSSGSDKIMVETIWSRRYFCAPEFWIYTRSQHTEQSLKNGVSVKFSQVFNLLFLHCTCMYTLFCNCILCVGVNIGCCIKCISELDYRIIYLGYCCCCHLGNSPQLFPKTKPCLC